MENETLQNDLGKALQETINSNYSEQTVITQYLDWLANNKE
jgi:hypothetical protein